MAEWLTPSNILFVLGLLGVIFGIFRYFRDPQVKSEKTDALIEQRMKLKEEDTNRRFEELGKRIGDAMTLAQNHIHTVDTKVEMLGKDIGNMNQQLVRLATIIEERVPKKIDITSVPQMLQ